MGHRKWSFGSAPAAEVSLKELEREHGELYDEWRASERRVMETLDENNRLDRELDEARQAQDNLIFQRNDFRHWHMNEQKKVADLTAELDAARKCIAELESPARVPFSDDQIERMASAALKASFTKNMSWSDIIRAALAAGCLEPCAVSEYEPADVALAPTGHVLRDRLVDAEAKIERQRKNLRQLYEARERDAQLIADLRAEVDEDNAAAANVNDLLVRVQNLTAERDRLAAENAELWSSRPAETAYLDLSNRQLIIDYEQALKGLAAADATLDRLREVVPKVLPPHMSWKDSLDGARAILNPPETTNDDR